MICIILQFYASIFSKLLESPTHIWGFRIDETGETISAAYCVTLQLSITSLTLDPIFHSRLSPAQYNVK